VLCVLCCAVLCCAVLCVVLCCVLCCDVLCDFLCWDGDAVRPVPSVVFQSQTTLDNALTTTQPPNHPPLNPPRYANRAKNITNKPHINEDSKDAMLREFQEEIARLRAQLEVGAGGSGEG